LELCNGRGAQKNLSDAPTMSPKSVTIVHSFRNNDDNGQTDRQTDRRIC